MNINIQYIVKFWDYLRKLFKPEREDVLLSKKYTELPEYSGVKNTLENNIAQATNVDFIRPYTFDEGSGSVRDSVVPQSGQVRQSFGGSSTAVRQVVEGQSKRSRTAAEQVSKLSRTSVDAKSSKSRTPVEEKEFGLILKNSQSRPDGNSIGGRKRLEEGFKNEIRSLGNNADDAFQSRFRIKGLTFYRYSSGIPRDWFGTHWPVARLLFGNFPNASRSGTKETPTNEQPISKQGASKDASRCLAGVNKQPEFGLESAINHQRKSIEKAKDKQTMGRGKAQHLQVSRTCFSLFYNQLHTNLYIFASLLRLRSEWASSLLRVISKGSRRGLEANLRKCRNWSGKGMKLVSNSQSVDQVWIVRKTVPIHALSTLYQRFIYASSILNPYLKGALFQIKTSKAFNFVSYVYVWFYVNNLLGRLKHFLNKMMAGDYDVVNEGVGVKSLKNIQIPLSLSQVLKSLLGTSKVLTSIRANALLVLMVSMFSLSAQTPRKDSGANGLSNLVALQPGDEIPDAVWDQTIELNYFDRKKKKIKFSDLKGKLIILDFWSTGCAACIEGIPKMEMIQERFKGKVEILLVNSKRNKDTPERIKNRFKKYKEDFNYTPTLATLLDDTLFTKLFEHNTLPSITILNRSGEFIATVNSKVLTDENIKAIYDGKSFNINNIGSYVNAGNRGGEKPLFDTAGVHYLSSFSGFRDHFLPVYPNLIYKGGTTYLKMGNQDLGFLLKQAFKSEMKGFSLHQVVFDNRLGKQFKLNLRNATLTANQYWYEFYSRDSVTQNVFSEVFKKDFQQSFQLAVAVRQDSINIYRVTFTDAVQKIVSREKMRIMRGSDHKSEIFYQRVPIENIINGLYYAFEFPIEIDDPRTMLVDLTIPEGFIYWETDRKLNFFKERGIVFSFTKEQRIYPYVYSLKQSN